MRSGVEWRGQGSPEGGLTPSSAGCTKKISQRKRNRETDAFRLLDTPLGSQGNVWVNPLFTAWHGGQCSSYLWFPAFLTCWIQSSLSFCIPFGSLGFTVLYPASQSASGETQPPQHPHLHLSLRHISARGPSLSPPVSTNSET